MYVFFNQRFKLDTKKIQMYAYITHAYRVNEHRANLWGIPCVVQNGFSSRCKAQQIFLSIFTERVLDFIDRCQLTDQRRTSGRKRFERESIADRDSRVHTAVRSNPMVRVDVTVVGSCSRVFAGRFQKHATFRQIITRLFFVSCTPAIPR